jgi:hypothetical protein
VTQKNTDHLVTNASIYTVHPVVTEHRFQVIEEIKAPSEGGGFWDYVLGGFGVFCLVAFLGWVFGY